MTIQKFTKKTALQYLAGNTHLFFSPEWVAALSEPFGFTPKCRVEKANPRDPKGLTFDDGRKEGEGLASWDLAAAICRHYDCKAEGKLGRGSQQRAYVEAVAKKLEIKL